MCGTDEHWPRRLQDVRLLAVVGQQSFELAMVLYLAVAEAVAGWIIGPSCPSKRTKRTKRPRQAHPNLVTRATEESPRPFSHGMVRSCLTKLLGCGSQPRGSPGSQIVEKLDIRQKGSRPIIDLGRTKLSHAPKAMIRFRDKRGALTYQVVWDSNFFWKRHEKRSVVEPLNGSTIPDRE